MCSLHWQGRAVKVWLPVSITRRFLEDYSYDRVLAVIDESSGALILYRITNKAEFDALFNKATELRPVVEVVQ